MAKTGRNEPCPCGSGKKFKRCCLATAAPNNYTADERTSALRKLEDFVEEELGPEDDAAYEEFYGRWGDRVDELDQHWTAVSEDAYDMWFAFDRATSDGGRPVDWFLRRDPLLTRGERFYLERVSGTAVRLYEVEDFSPGVSLTLRDVERGTCLTVHERLGSRSIPRGTLVAARVVDQGPSGQPEIERGLLNYPDLVRDSLKSQLDAHQQSLFEEDPEIGPADVDEIRGLFLDDAWLSLLLDPPLPRLKTTDGEDVVFTRVRFDVDDEEGLAPCLDEAGPLEREPGRPGIWHWSGKNREGKEVALGRIVLSGRSLTLECHSDERGARGRAMLEGLGGSRLRHVSTLHESPAAAIRDRVRARDRGEEGPPDTGLSREEQEALTLDHLARHYRRWIDEPVPALDGQTPRAAAKDEALRPMLVDLLRGLEGSYEKALRRAEPAYDPAWMWNELELPGRSSPAHPPPLAAERMESLMPGLGELCRTVAAHVRSRPGFDDTATILTAEEMEASLAVQRFLRKPPGPAGGDAACDRAATARLGDPLRWLIEYETHRRKTFWVDESLAYMLAQTDCDVPGGQLRVPFPSFALVFTDRHVLSLAERLLSTGPSCPVAGYRLRVLTIHVSEERSAAGRVLRMGFAADPLGADPPHWIRQDVPLEENTPVQGFLDGLAPIVISDPPVPDAHPWRGLVRVALNAILYSVSAGVEAEFRLSPAGARRGAPAQAFSSDAVYFLPGAIEISRVRRMQELERVPSGRGLLHRFMVRGHWRRPATEWKDQRMRWIEPYWKGPDLAAVIERTYRLEP